MVVDLDVHQGNGTAAMLAEHPRCLTLSVHADQNYPWHSRRPSDVDEALPDSVTGEEYLEAVRRALNRLETAAAKAASAVDASSDLRWMNACGSHGGGPAPGAGRRRVTDLVLFQAGVDPLSHDRLGRLGLTRSDLWARNQLVYAWCAERGLPVLVTMGGGYSRPIERSVEAHADCFLQAGRLGQMRRQEGETWHVPVAAAEEASGHLRAARAATARAGRLEAMRSGNAAAKRHHQENTALLGEASLFKSLPVTGFVPAAQWYDQQERG
jgi:acetoin utilization deacetylase AcuC-like enzyme